jgi:hypothetical protein
MTAMGRGPRQAFDPPPLAAHAYQDMPLPIGFDKAISQPFIVAAMTDLLEPRPDDVEAEGCQSSDPNRKCDPNPARKPEQAFMLNFGARSGPRSLASRAGTAHGQPSRAGIWESR